MCEMEVTKDKLLLIVYWHRAVDCGLLWFGASTGSINSTLSALCYRAMLCIVGAVERRACQAEDVKKLSPVKTSGLLVGWLVDVYYSK